MTKWKISLAIILILSGVLFVKMINKENDKQNLAVYVDGKYQGSIPKKGEAIFEKAICDNNATVSWNDDSWSLLITNLNQKTKCNLYFYGGSTTFSFDYTGGEQIFTAPISGTYKLEAWGASGGNATSDALTAKGGLGGYATGYVKLNADDKLFLNIGGKGVDTSLDYNETPTSGTIFAYNGGSCEAVNKNTKWAGGGGATHIALKYGLLSSLENSKDSILIISGAGGGAGLYMSETNEGGSAGGYNGNNGNGYDAEIVLGGSQISGGSSADFSWGDVTNKIKSSFGVGASFGSGGGSGYYGGGSGWRSGSSGAGGSSYIGNSSLTEKVMYCYNCEESSEESTKTISTTCTSETPTENCAKQGNGYARITLVSSE